MDRFVLLLLVPFVADCATYRKPRPDLPLSERSAAELTALLEDFNLAVEEERFDVATDMLAELEDGVKSEDPRIARQRNFMLVAERIGKSRGHLKEAKRQFAITSVITEGDEKMAAGETLLERLTSAPTEEAAEEFKLLLEELREVEARGNPYKRDGRYAEHRLRLMEHLERWTFHSKQVQWVLTSTAELAEILGEMPSTSGDEEPSIDDLIDDSERLLENLAECRSFAPKLGFRLGFAEEITLETRFGPLTLDEIILACDQQEPSERARLDTLRWQRRVDEVARGVADTMAELTEAESPEVLLDIVDDIAAQLGECEESLKGTENGVGYDQYLEIETALGRVTALGLREACAAERRRLVDDRATLHWRIALKQVQSSFDSAKSLVEAAMREESAEDRIEPLAEAVQNLQSCADTAAVLIERSTEPYDAAKPSAAEEKEIQSLNKICPRDLEGVKTLLARARKDAV